jgi:hypothetical protein
VESKHLQFRLEEQDYALVESIAKQMGLSVNRTARHLAIAGARVTAGMHKPPAELINGFQHDIEEFRASLETLNDVTTDGMDGVKRDLQAVDKLLVALLRGILQIVAISRRFGEAHDKQLLESALAMAEQSMKQMLQERRSTPQKASTESHA